MDLLLVGQAHLAVVTRGGLLVKEGPPALLPLGWQRKEKGLVDLPRQRLQGPDPRMPGPRPRQVDLSTTPREEVTVL